MGGPGSASPRQVEWSLDRPVDRPDDPSPWWGRAVLLLIAATVVAGVVAVRGPAPPGSGLVSTPAVLGTHLEAPIAVRLPSGAAATADGTSVGMALAGGASVLITLPTQVADPSGRRSPIPADPAAWLRGNPDVLVSRVRQVDVAGGPATQVDYQRSPDARPPGRSARLSLFCGLTPMPVPGQPAPGQAPATCTRITSFARVRATFVRVRERTVLVEVVWTAPDVTGGIPAGDQRSYAAVLDSLTPRPL